MKILKNLRTYIILGILAILILAGIQAYRYEVKPILPAKDSKQISYVVYWPKDRLSKPSKTSIKVAKDQDGTTILLSFYDFVGTDRITFVEQATPSSFSQDPGSFTSFIHEYDNYDTISTATGTVYLTMPSNRDTAVANNKGTLLFASSNKTLPVSTWRLIFNNLSIIEN